MLRKLEMISPFYRKKFNGKPIIYFDNVCTTLKPRQMIDAMVEYYTEYTDCEGNCTCFPETCG